MTIKSLGFTLAVVGLACALLVVGTSTVVLRADAQYVPLERVEKAPSTATTATNLCVDCHRREETARAFPDWARDQIIHWYGAVHGREGVTCEQCHGGNARAADKDEAHEGVISPRNPNSPLHYKKVAGVCGTCHSAVFEQFTHSSHYQVLMADHLAPSCTTCHGFQMDTVVPEQLIGRCGLCHNERRGNAEYQAQARAAVDGSAHVAEAIDRAKVAVSLAREQGLDPGVAQALVETAEWRLGKLGQQWHEFEMDGFTRELTAIQRITDLAYDTATSLFLPPKGEGPAATGGAAEDAGPATE